jgi:hypothetical protein
MVESANQFYGDPSGGVLDTFGNQWWFGTWNKEISSEEMAKLMQKARSQG